MITSILMATEMAISVLVEALLPGGGGTAAQGKSGDNGKAENAKEWLRNKLKALASLLGKLRAKAAETFPASLGQSSAGSSIG